MINVEVKGKENPNEYPVLRIHRDGDFIVLFSSESTGVVIQSYYHEYSVGDHDLEWVDSEFTDFHGTITLSNGENQ